MTTDDAHRPLVHLTAPAQWINDPNGLVFADGEYHACFQINPDGDQWGGISWGHAVSTDLMRWTHLDVALRPYVVDDGATALVFSGSAARLGPHHLRAYYTEHVVVDASTPRRERVAVADSLDGGRTWSRHAGNPVLDTGRGEFRDPKVWWHAPSGRWSMVIAVADEQAIECYASDDGLAWDRVGRFDSPTPIAGALWECPELVEIPVRGADTSKWVLFVSTQHAVGAPYTGMRYWVGEFDGRTFVPDAEESRSVDHGRDFFAGICVNGLGDGERPVMIGWASDWAYASATPTSPWRGALSLPRMLELAETPTGARLVQSPVAQYAGVVGDPLDEMARHRAADVRATVGSGRWIALRFETSVDEWFAIGVDASGGDAAPTLWFDRRSSGHVDCHAAFGVFDEVTIDRDAVGADGSIDLHVVVDHCVVEVFAAGGRVAMCQLVFPTGPWRLCRSGEAMVGVRSIRP